MPIEYRFKIRIRWGSNSDGETQETRQYEFTTLNELNCFVYGVAEAEGWADYARIDPNPDGSWPGDAVEVAVK